MPNEKAQSSPGPGDNLVLALNMPNARAKQKKTGHSQTAMDGWAESRRSWCSSSAFCVAAASPSHVHDTL